MNKEHLHPEGRPYTKEEFVEKIKTDKKFAERFGNLGKIYGYQWRNWNGEIDQISELIRQLKEEPDSRRMVVNAWAVHDLPKMTLPPCHYGFQVYTRELDETERVVLMDKRLGVTKNLPAYYTEDEMIKYSIPKRAISLMWNQRSVDTFLGLPFNIASYGLLLEIIAKTVNMVPDQLIGNLGDVHLYSNHVEQAKEQIGRELIIEERVKWAYDRKLIDYITMVESEELDRLNVPTHTRQPYPLPTLKIESEVKWNEGDCLPYYSPSDFTIENYQSYPTIKAPLSN